jgi:hypothetical protein
MATTGEIVRLILMGTISSSADAQPVSVCDVLSNLDRYRGKVIAVQAMLFSSSHGLVLQDKPGHEPCESARKQGHIWPPAIAATQGTKYSDLEDGPARFESDIEQI